MEQEQLKTYYKQVGKRLHCEKAQKKQILDGLRTDVEEFRLAHPDCSFEDIQEHFGSPEDIARQYLDDISAFDLQKELSVKKMVKRLILVIIICILFITACIGGLAWERHVKRPAYYTETID